MPKGLNQVQSLTAIIMSRRYDTKQDSKTTIKKQKSNKALSARNYRAATQSSSQAHVFSVAQGPTPNKSRMSTQFTPHSRLLLRTSTTTDKPLSCEKPKKKHGWGDILHEVDFLKRKISQLQRPTFGKQPGDTFGAQPSLSTTATLPKELQNTANRLYGKEYSLESFHLLYEEIMYLRKENQILRESVKQNREELEYQRKEAVKMSKVIRELRQENEKIRDQFLGRRIEEKKKDTNQEPRHLKTQNAQPQNSNKKPPNTLHIATKTQSGSVGSLTSSSSSSNPNPSTKQLRSYTTKATTTTQPPPQQYLLPQHPFGRSLSNEQNLLEDPQPHLIDKQIKQLNEKFEILLFNSKYEKDKEGRSEIKEELFTVTSKLRALQQQRAMLNLMPQC